MKTSTLVFACYEKACAPPPAGRGGSSRKGGSRYPASATKSAFRDADAITARKSGGAVHTRHRGRNWDVTVMDAKYKVTHKASGRERDPEAALDRILDEYFKHSS